jgi:hypothetical protein
MIFVHNTSIDTSHCRRQSVSIQKSELEHIQARIRETEERLKESQGGSASSASITQQSQRIPGRRPPGLGSVPLVESDEEEDEGSDSSESSGSESDDESAGVNKPLRNSQSTAQTSPSEASDSDTEDEDDNEEEDEEEEKGKQPTPRRQSTSQSSPIYVGKQQPPSTAGKRPTAKQGQRTTLPSRGKA